MPSRNPSSGSRDAWERLSHLLLLGFSKITTQPSLEGEFRDLLSHADLVPPFDTELHRVFALVAPNAGERIVAYRANAVKAQAAKDALEDCLDKVKSCDFVLHAITGRRRVLLAAIEQHHILVQKRRNLNVRMSTLEWVLSSVTSTSDSSEADRLIIRRNRLTEKKAAIDREISSSSELISSLGKQVEGLQARYDDHDLSRNISLTIANDLNSSVKECEEENWAIDLQTKKLAQLIASTFQFDLPTM